MTGAAVSRGLVLTEAAARELLAALDALDRLAQPQGQRLSASLHGIRRELLTCVTRVSTHAAARPDDVAALMVSESSVMGLDTAIAAGHLGITADGVRWLCRRGHLDAVRYRGRWLVDRPSLDRYRAERDRTRIENREPHNA